MATVSPRPIKAVAFDLDGVLIDSEPVFIEAARRVLASRDKLLDESFMRSVMGIPGRVVLPMFRERFLLEESVEQLALEYREHFLGVLTTRPMRLMPGVWELLAAVEARSLPKAIATSSNRQYVERVVGPTGLLERFAFALTSDDVREGKPHPEVYELAARRLGVGTAEMLVIEDSPAGVKAAIAAGAVCVAVPQPHTPRELVETADLIVVGLGAPELMALLT